MNYTCIDFETANSLPQSACCIGIVRFERGKIVFSKSYLIKPHKRYRKFNFYNVKIHGIEKKDIVGAPEFNEIWDEIKHFFEGETIVCHNAIFDMGVLRKTLQLYKMKIPSCKYICTVEISQKVWNNLQKHKLNIISEHLGISLNHHNAESDARAAGLVLKEALKEKQSRKISSLMRKISLEIKDFN